MRRLVNNWLFGEVSPRMSGRLDTDVYGNSCSELTNMHVFRQGGISRRPPLMKTIEVSGYERIISGKYDSSTQGAFLLGAGKLAYTDFESVTEIDLPTGWSGITATQVWDVRVARYYNDFYMVHPSFPLMRIRQNIGFEAGLPHLFVNQDISRKYIELTLGWGVATSEELVFTFNGRNYNINVSTGESASEFAKAIESLQIDGWTSKADANVISFRPDDVVDSYRKYDDNWEGFGFRKKNTNLPPSSFTPTFRLKDEQDQKKGLVYGEDAFDDCWLNQIDPYGEPHYPCDIAIIGERMWLLVDSDTPQVYVSRPYRTSQIVYPKDSNDTILDFIQFELVATTSTQMKEQDYLPIKEGKDADGEPMWEGVSNDQRIWIPPAHDAIKTRSDLNAYRADNEFTLEYDPEHINVVTKLTCGDTVINYQNCFYLTYDTVPDMNKLVFDSDTGRHYSDVYSSSNQTATRIWVVEPATTSNGLEYEYHKTEDIRPATRTRYYRKVSDNVYAYVASPSQSDMQNMYERSVVFSDINPTSQTFKPVYEYGKQYVMGNRQLRLKTTYNSMIYTLSDVDVVGGQLVETVICAAIPYYVFDTSMTSEMYEDTTTLDKVATASTGMQFMLATGRNDHLRWIALGDSIMIGTDSTEWRMPPDMNALDGSAKIYSSFGTAKGITANINTDLVYVQHGNLLRMFYTDDYGLQTLELSSINPEIMQGSIYDIVSCSSPEPTIDILIDGDIIHLCVDRTNGVQAFSRWTFADDIKSICGVDTYTGSFLCALVESQYGQYIGIFDNTGDVSSFRDCGYTHFLSADTQDEGKTYYELDDGEYVDAENVTNPKAQGLYEFGLRNGVIDYTSRMTANPFDSVMEDGSVTLGEYKNVSKIILRCLDTGHIRTYYNSKDQQVTRTPVCCNREGTYVGGLADHAINVNGGSVKDLMITVESVGDEPMTLLAMAYETRINRNG